MMTRQPKAYSLAAKQMEKTVWEAGWDGAWFRRAYDDFGDPVGSQECEEGQIFIEPQGMCVMAGLGIMDGRARKALELGGGATGDASRHHAAPTGLYALLSAPG